MNPENQTATDRARDHRSPAWVSALTGIGAEWAKFGLSVGTQALERSAKSLELAAKTLETLSKAFDRDAIATARNEASGGATEAAVEDVNEHSATEAPVTEAATTEDAADAVTAGTDAAPSGGTR